MLEHQVRSDGGYLSGESSAGGWLPPGPQSPGCRAARRWGTGHSSCGGTGRRAACTAARPRFRRCPRLCQRSTRGSRLRKVEDRRSFTRGSNRQVFLEASHPPVSTHTRADSSTAPSAQSATHRCPTPDILTLASPPRLLSAAPAQSLSQPSWAHREAPVSHSSIRRVQRRLSKEKKNKKGIKKKLRNWATVRRCVLAALPQVSIWELSRCGRATFFSFFLLCSNPIC